MIPATSSVAALHRIAATTSRPASEAIGVTGPVTPAGMGRRRRAISDLSCVTGRGDAVAEPAHRLDEVGRDLLAQAADEHLDGVGVAVKVLVVEVLDELGARHDAVAVQHQ